MTLRIRKGETQAALDALATELNLRREAAVSTNVHYSTSRLPSGAALAITAANASSLATSRVLANQIRAVLNQHFADRSAHGTVFTAAVALGEVSATLEDAAELAAIVALANQMKLRFNTGGHINTANVHPNNDATNTIAAADATDQTSANTLLNELKTDVNAHIILALAGNHIEFSEA